jgi:hypothetical protein
MYIIIHTKFGITTVSTCTHAGSLDYMIGNCYPDDTIIVLDPDEKALLCYNATLALYNRIIYQDRPPAELDAISA